MTDRLPVLPLLLWETPPGLAQVLGQEGVAFAEVADPHPMAFAGGRFVLYDSRRIAARKVRASLPAGHDAIDVNDFRRLEAADPFAALIDTEGAPATWRVAGLRLTERVARRPKAEIRRRLVNWLRATIDRRGGLWARLAPYPFPYRSAFNFRADLDELLPEDYARFAAARRPLDDCTTHFVSTHAYGGVEAVLGDLRGRDAQSHGHHHVVTRDPELNRRNLRRAHDILVGAGLDPSGFAGPGGRWNAGLDRALEGLGYEYSSDFQLGYDDLPFFPWLGDRPSRVVQVPIHPICEGLFLEAGAGEAAGRMVADYLAAVVRAKVEAGEPAFVYGHPERRLGRMPEVLPALVEAIAGKALVWRVTLTEFARWWRWRLGRRWSVIDRGRGRLEVQFDDWDDRYSLGLEVLRGEHAAAIPIRGPRLPLLPDALAFERRVVRADLPEPQPVRRPWSLKRAAREALDWEVVTPTDDLPAGSVVALLKRGLRRWREDGRWQIRDGRCQIAEIQHGRVREG